MTGGCVRCHIAHHAAAHLHHWHEDGAGPFLGLAHADGQLQETSTAVAIDGVLHPAANPVIRPEDVIRLARPTP